MQQTKTLYINGIASFFGSHQISNQLLHELNPNLGNFNSNVSLRYSVLPENYLKETCNRDLSAAQHFALESPSQLAAAAVFRLIEKTGVKLEQIGLVIADTVTPRQTIPAEAQRICRLLGLKVPCFDITSGSLAFARFFDTLLSWKEERIPEYVLLISTNSPTERINFACDRSACYFSDASVAMLVSTCQTSATKVKKVIFNSNKPSSKINIPIFAKLECDLDQQLERLDADYDTRFAPLANQVPYAAQGYSFGTSFGVALEELTKAKTKFDSYKVICGNSEQSSIIELSLGGQI